MFAYNIFPVPTPPQKSVTETRQEEPSEGLISLFWLVLFIASDQQSRNMARTCSPLGRVPTLSHCLPAPTATVHSRLSK